MHTETYMYICTSIRCEDNPVTHISPSSPPLLLLHHISHFLLSSLSFPSLSFDSIRFNSIQFNFFHFRPIPPYLSFPSLPSLSPPTPLPPSSYPTLLPSSSKSLTPPDGLRITCTVATPGSPSPPPNGICKSQNVKKKNEK